MQADFSVTFVCMGNICRSPTAHGVFRRMVSDAGLARRVRVDSAGTHDLHPGEGADLRSQRHAKQRGYDLSGLRARQLTVRDFARSDLLLVMDWDNLRAAEARCSPEHRHKLRRLTEFCLRHSSEIVPDPYYGGVAGFEHVLDLIEDACTGLLDHVRREVAQRGSAGSKQAPRGAGRIVDT